MNINLKRWLTVFAFISITTIYGQKSHGDPLPGRDLLKFEQKPMIGTTIVDTTGVTIGTYAGHDELSTAYAFPNAAQQYTDYQGRFMADDFADKLTSPVVHVKWWGSYHNDFMPIATVPLKFLIAFESDVPAVVPGYSTPGNVLQADVVTFTNGSLAAGGLYNEKFIRGPDALLNESLYEYNAELHLNKAFSENKDTVYWLKIAALVDVPLNIAPFPGSNPPPTVAQWGWHNRDYTISNPNASTAVTTFPFGEFVDGTMGTSNVYHFQDDAVTGDLRYTTLAGVPNFGVQQQSNMQPTNYMGGADGPFTGQIPGTVGIDTKSKDLAFAIYTTQIVPEPTTCLLLMSGVLGVAMLRRRRAG